MHRAADAVELELCDGKVSRGLVQVGYDWAWQRINVPPAKHKYTLLARNTGTVELPEPFVLDTFACINETPSAGHNGFADSDGHFIPTEFDGEWFVDNMRGSHQGEAAVHPPVIGPRGEATLWVDCGDATGGIEFVVHRAVDNAELELFDGEGSRGVIDVGYDWAAKTFVAAGPLYRFVARNTGTMPIAEAFVLDTFQCKD